MRRLKGDLNWLKKNSEIETSYSAALHSFITKAKSFRPLIRTSSVTADSTIALSDSFVKVKMFAEKVMEKYDEELHQEHLEFGDQILKESFAHDAQKGALRSFFFGTPKFSAELQAKKASYLVNNQRFIEREREQATVLYAGLIQLYQDCLDTPTQDAITSFSCNWVRTQCHKLQKHMIKLEAISSENQEHMANGTATIHSLENVTSVGFCPYKL